MQLLREYLPVARNLRHRDARYPDDASQLAGLAKGGGRIAAIKVLVSTSLTCNYIERVESEGRSIVDAMSRGEQEGMQTSDGVLENSSAKDR